MKVSVPSVTAPDSPDMTTGSPSSGTAVVSEWRKVRVPTRLIRNVEPQFGSMQATSASVVIQSFGWVMRCLAGSKGRSPAMV